MGSDYRQADLLGESLGRALVPRPLATEGEARELRHFRNGAVFGLVGGVIGLVLPISWDLLGIYSAVGLAGVDPALVSFTSLFALVGALFLAVSLIFYQWAFRALRKYDRSFLAASFLCLVGTAGFLLLIVSLGITLATSPSVVQCVQATPSLAYTCLDAAPPLTVYSVISAFWLAWCGGLGIVIGLELCGRRYREPRLVGGGVAYALLLLVLIDPFVAFFFPVGGWQYPVLTVPVLALVAPALVFGSSYVQKSIPPRALAHLLPERTWMRSRHREPPFPPTKALEKPALPSSASNESPASPPLGV